MMSGVKDLVVRLLGTGVVAGAMGRVMPGDLRVIAYHGVKDPDAFRLQLDMIHDRYRAVGGAEVVASIRGESQLPDDAVWITFDDGARTVVENALPLLIERSMPATMFVCPGMVTTDQRSWWEVVELAASWGWTTDCLPSGMYVTSLKQLPDDQRRRMVDLAADYLTAEQGVGPPKSVAARASLESWLAAGLELGNHTWDHPCLDRCGVEEQRQQVIDADRWLDDLGAFRSVRLFAYPNGDWTADTESVLGELGYDLALLFDHRIAALDRTNPLRISRLRLDTSAPVNRARAVLSGGHSLVYGARRPGVTGAVVP